MARDLQSERKLCLSVQKIVDFLRFLRTSHTEYGDTGEALFFLFEDMASLQWENVIKGDFIKSSLCYSFPELIHFISIFSL
jgi:hypothetical protein